MLMMTWPLARLGSRFGLLFEPGHRRVMHSALGRFFDQPLDLAVGLIEEDGTERVLPFTAHGRPLFGLEQFERINSITYRGFSESTGLRIELNFHSPFYPEYEQVSAFPAFYFELRVIGEQKLRLRKYDRHPAKVRLFVRLSRPDTRITAGPGRIDLSYRVPLKPGYTASCGDNDSFGQPVQGLDRGVEVRECIHSLNEGAEPVTDAQGRTGLTLELPVTEEGSGIKWRLIWASHVGEPVLEVRGLPARLRTARHWKDLESLLQWSVEHRDENLALSRRFEKLLEQAPLRRAQWHAMVMAFQSYLSNTWWCDVQLPDGQTREFFSVWEGNVMFHNTLDVAYNMSLFYLALWPRLLRLCLDEWPEHRSPHEPSGGQFLHHDLGRGCRITSQQAYDHPMPVEENCNFLLLLQAYSHWTGDKSLIFKHAELLRNLSLFLLWTDLDNDGFPDEGVANTLDDASIAVQFSRKQTYLAIKRACALEAATDLLTRAGHADLSAQCAKAAAFAVTHIEAAAWLDDHYAVCIDKYRDIDMHTGETILLDHLEGWDDYSLYTSNALLLPSIIAHPLPFEHRRLNLDLVNGFRETMRNYGCGHTSSDSTNVWISQNLWRDITSRYLHVELMDLDTRYWDLLVSSNTGSNSFGYIDTHIGNELAFNPRGVTSFGAFLAGPRMVIDRLDTEYYAINPDRHRPQRWPLLPLADWQAGRIPICVVHTDGHVSIEGEIEPVKVIEPHPMERDPTVIG